MLDEVVRRRAEQAADLAAQPPVEDFRITTLGSRWTVIHKGVGADAVKAACKGQDAENFCSVRGLPKSFRAELTYGWDISNSLCKGWADKMQFFLNLARAEGNLAHVFTGAQIVSFKEAPEFSSTALSLLGNVNGMSRVNVVRQLFT